ncbi:MAG: hypothetical protein ACHQJ6_08995 [Candidatus Berkiellales bacterium]
MAPPNAKNVLIVELNEFNADLLASAIQQYSFPNLAKVLSLPRSSTLTDDFYHSGYLEPWVQWVSIHTGVPSSTHKIKHLGDVPYLHYQQCWDGLGEHQVTTGVWGCMNSSCNQKNVLFFLPDPWTFSEEAVPKVLNRLLALPRYLAKNYRNLKPWDIVAKAINLFRFIATSGVGGKIFKESIKLFFPLRKFSKQSVFIVFFDYIATLFFIQYKKRYLPQCAFLFLNSLAHLQHHHWREGGVTPEILFGLQTLEKIFAALFKAFPHDALVVHNGLSQMNTHHEKPWVLYRQKDPIKFLKALEIPFVRVEQNMTHDGHAFFATPEACQQAYSDLTAAKIQQQALFHVEINPSDPCKLFYQLSFTDQMENKKEVVFEFRGKAYRFFNFFDEVITRTGRHIPMGTILSDTIYFPHQLYNHEFNHYLYYYLLPMEFPMNQSFYQEVAIR